MRDQKISEVFEDTRVARFIGIAERGAANFPMNAEMIKLRWAGRETSFDIAETFAERELRKDHGKELVETGERLHFIAAAISGGFPKGRAKAIGQCWNNTQSEDRHYEIFVSPEIADDCRTLDILPHEIGHVAAGLACGHKGAFKRFVNDAGLEGRATVTSASPELLDALRMGVLPHLGSYPHAELRGENSGKKKQTTRMVKQTCPGCGMVIRTTQKWIEETGAPVCCSCQEQFQTEEGEGE